MTDFVIPALSLLAYMCFWFVVSLIQRRNDVADIAWGLGFVLLVWLTYYLHQPSGARPLIVCILVSVWGMRLSWHIYHRNQNKTEDYRYLKWRQEWGRWFYWRSFAQVYMLQGLLLFIIALPVLIIQKEASPPMGLLDFIGLTIWLTGFYFEVVGDAQLARFLRDGSNKGKLMQEGLWAYTRHPNYFGEVLLWWGIGILALNVPNGWMGLLGPLTLTYLIVNVSGIPMLEEKMKAHPDFAAYQKKTNVFFPMPPRGQQR